MRGFNAFVCILVNKSAASERLPWQPVEFVFAHQCASHAAIHTPTKAQTKITDIHTKGQEHRSKMNKIRIMMFCLIFDIEKNLQRYADNFSMI